MATAAYNTTVETHGASTAFTGEACSLVSGKTYQIDNTAKRVWVPSVTPTVKDNGVTVAAANIESYDKLFGKVTFVNSYTVTGPVTVDGNYYPLLTLAECRAVSAEFSVTELNTSVFGTAGVKRIAGLMDGDVEIDRLDFPDTDLDGGVGEVKLRALLLARTPLLVSIRPGGAGDYIRGWFIGVADNIKTGVDALVEPVLKLRLAAQNNVAAGIGS